MPSRRQLLQASALASGLGALGLTASTVQAATAGPVYAYVGTYSDGGKPWRGGRGLGVHQFVLDSATGALKPIPGAPPAVASTGEGAKLRNPASLARHPTLPMLYAANEFEAGSVSAFRIGTGIGANGALSFVSEMPCGGKDPAYISVHPDGRFLFTANYASGDVSVIALRADGTPDIDRAAVVYKDAEACGAAACKPGADVVPAAARLSHEGFATSDHDGPHAHMVHADPKGNFVLVADLGLDRVISYRFDRGTGVLSQPSTVAVSESSGARHFIFHPNGKWFYLVNEEASTIAFMRYDDASGVLTLVSETSALPKGFKGTSYASGIRMLPDGQHFVSLNRLHDSISLFKIDPRTGAPTLVREEWSRGNYPRSCTPDPSGRFLYVCHNKQGDNVTVFRVKGGDIRFTGQYVAVGSAAAIEFFRVMKKSLLRYIASRAAGMLVVLAIVAVLVFVLTRAASGDPVSVLLGDQATAADIARVQKEYGLDKPLPVQFGYWLREVLQGNLGTSIFLQRPVTQALWERSEPTTLLALMAVAIAALIGVPCGIVSAVFRGRVVDQLFTGIAMLGASIPGFWLGIVLIQIFAVSFGWFPVSGYGAPDAPFAERLHALVLPATVLGLLNSALIIRFTRASMLDVLGEDYVRTARSKGLSESVVVLKHALRNALVPIVTVIGLTVALMIGGAVITETVFGLPGVGNLVVSAVLRRDYPVIQGALLVIAAIYVLINFSIDLLYAVVDPRVKV